MADRRWASAGLKARVPPASPQRGGSARRIASSSGSAIAGEYPSPVATHESRVAGVGDTPPTPARSDLPLPPELQRLPADLGAPVLHDREHECQPRGAKSAQ